MPINEEWYSLGHDVDIVYGGLWFNPQTVEVIEVVDLDSATGIDGTNMIQRGSIYITDESIRKGASFVGAELEFEGIARVLHNAKDIPVEDYNEYQLNALLKAAYWTRSYAGFDTIEDIIIIGEKGRTKPIAQWREEVEQFRPTKVIRTTNAAFIIKSELRKMGVSRKEMA